MELTRCHTIISHYQALLGMNRLDAAIIHLYTALEELGVHQPVTRPRILLRIYMELFRQAMRHLIPDNLARNGR